MLYSVLRDVPLPERIATELRSAFETSVHWSILPGYFASPFDGLDVWETSQTVMLAGRQIQTLSPEHLLILICSHSAKHAFERLGWICDISRFLIVTPNLNWSAIVNQAE